MKRYDLGKVDSKWLEHFFVLSDDLFVCLFVCVECEAHQCGTQSILLWVVPWLQQTTAKVSMVFKESVWFITVKWTKKSDILVINIFFNWEIGTRPKQKLSKQSLNHKEKMRTQSK